MNSIQTDEHPLLSAKTALEVVLIPMNYMALFHQYTVMCGISILALVSYLAIRYIVRAAGSRPSYTPAPVRHEDSADDGSEPS